MGRFLCRNDQAMFAHQLKKPRRGDPRRALLCLRRDGMARR
jgi:hypothetical protein